ncbi:MAG: DUF3794 domain-containing protein, partial [Ruminococcaceae bacterium]|nr:DUF3794 domain-containing protein [Oscillospiraceae bacterium]
YVHDETLYLDIPEMQNSNEKENARLLKRHNAIIDAIKGSVSAHILYLPAEGTGIESIRTILPFQHSFSLEEDCFAETEVEMGEVSYYLYHSRKLNLKATVWVRKQISMDCTYQVLTGCEADCDTEMKHITTPFMSEHLCSEQIFAVREQLELTGSLPDIQNILFCEGKVRDTEVRLMTNKAMIKGEIVLSFFYYSIEETTEYAEHVIPFTEVVDAAGMTEEMKVESVLTLSGLQLRVDEDSEGDMRLLFADAKIFVQINAMLTDKAELIEDLFCTEIPLEYSFHTLSYSEIHDSASKEVGIRENVSCEEQPSIDRVYLLEPSVWIDSVSNFDGKTKVEGTCIVSILYQSLEKKYCSLSKEISFMQEFEDEMSRGDIKVSTGHFSYHLLSSNEIEIRGTMYIEGTTVKTIEIPCVINAEPRENEECNETRPSLVIYFVQKGDTLWNIAKRYCVTRDSVIVANKLGDENLVTGQKILIPR